MKKYILLALLFATCNSTDAQVIDARFRSMSYDEMAAPLRMAQAAYEKAQMEIEECIIKSYEAGDKQSWRLEKYYLEKALKKNADFDNNILGREDVENIKKRISWLDNTLKKQEAKQQYTR